MITWVLSREARIRHRVNVSGQAINIRLANADDLATAHDIIRAADADVEITVINRDPGIAADEVDSEFAIRVVGRVAFGRQGQRVDVDAPLTTGRPTPKTPAASGNKLPISDSDFRWDDDIERSILEIEDDVHRLEQRLVRTQEGGREVVEQPGSLAPPGTNRLLQRS